MQYRMCHHEDRLYRKLSQDGRERQLILTRNAELRKSPGVIVDKSLGRYCLSIPIEDYEALGRKYPELKSPCNETRRRFYQRFLRSPESLPYRVQPGTRGS